jgi:hypothetical protein
MLEYVQEALIKTLITTTTAVLLVSQMKPADGQIRTSFNAFDGVHTAYIKRDVNYGVSISGSFFVLITYC